MGLSASESGKPTRLYAAQIVCFESGKIKSLYAPEPEKIIRLLAAESGKIKGLYAPESGKIKGLYTTGSGKIMRVFETYFECNLTFFFYLTGSDLVPDHLDAGEADQGARLGKHSFQKNATFLRSFAFFSKECNVLAFFCVLYKKTAAFFAFFYVLIKECCVLCVLLHSL